MFNNSFLSDVTIRLIVKEESKTYYGHKAILCAHSEFFMKAFNGNFNEATEGTINLHDDDPIQFEAMLKFMYTMVIPGVEPGVDFWKPALNFIGLYAVADKYGVQQLKVCASEKLATLTYLREHRLKYKSFKAVVEAHYSNNVERNSLMVQALALKMNKGWWSLTRNPESQDLIKKYPNYGADVLLVFLSTGNTLPP